MMELSTIIPSTTIKAANVTVFNGMPTAYIIPIDIKNTNRNGSSRNNSRFERKKQHHHQDNDHDGDKQVTHKRTHRIIHHLGLVRNPLNGHAFRKLFLESCQHLIHFLSVLYNIIAFPHLHGKDDSLLSVIHYITVEARDIHGQYVLCLSDGLYSRHHPPG